MLVVDRQAGTFHDELLANLPQILSAGDLLIFNNTRVSARRLRLQRRSGARIEAVFLEETVPGHWSVLLRGAAKVRPQEELVLEGAEDVPVRFRFEREPGQGPGNCLLIPVNPGGTAAWQSPVDSEAFFAAHGELPIPPYLGRPAQAIDQERYQTILAEETGSVAAPTAGLHFSDELLAQLAAGGVEETRLELLIGYGTFAPLTPENFARGELHREFYRIPDPCARAYAGAHGRRIAVGTTTLRALESERRAAPPDSDAPLRPGLHSTTLFVRPPDPVRSADALITNFHLPRSSLLLFVAAFAGEALLMEAYAHALQAEYRFYSYGDAMLIIDGAPESS